jgi:hypoxanthine phosphoribosyltransferase
MAYHADSTDHADKEVLTWEGFGRAQRELAQAVVDSGFEPTIIIAVARGGMSLAGALTYALGVKLTDAINVEFYTDVHETLPDPVLLAPMLDTESIAGQRILVADDVADSGRTLGLVMKLLRGFGADVRSAVLYSKPSTIVTPDYVWKATDQWIVFPWSDEPPVQRRGGQGG